MSLNITDAIFSRAASDPRAIAVIDADRTIDYRALCHGVRLAARRFREAGWKAGDRVGLAVGGSPTLLVISSLALARMGVAQVLLPAGDPAPLRRARFERLAMAGLVSDEGQAASGTGAVAVAPEPGWLTASAPAADIREPGGGRLCFIRETSGTTAMPKVIGISHDAEDAHRRAAAGVFSHLPGERFLNLGGLQFFTALRRANFCLSDGATLTLPPAGLTTDQVLRWIDVHRVTHISCVPLHLHYLLRDIGTSAPRLPAVRILRSGTAALSASTVRDVRRRISPNLYISYGISEAGTIAAATPAMLDANPETAGRPLPGVEFEIVDDEDKPVADGVAGHVRIRGAGVVSAYLDAAGPQQARAFRNGWFYPGDIALKSGDGLIFHKGRSDEVMNFDGILVGPVEIESVLCQHPGVTEAAAFALPSSEHHEIPAAAIVSAQPIDSAELERFCAERLGVRAPRLFVQIDALPRNAMGKIQRNRLVELTMPKLRERSGSR